jgi:hypothetical protein
VWFVINREKGNESIYGFLHGSGKVPVDSSRRIRYVSWTVIVFMPVPRHRNEEKTGSGKTTCFNGNSST